MRYAPLAVERLVAAVCVCRPYAAKPIGASGCQGCAAPSAARPGLDAGASEDYRAWPSQDGKPQRPEAGQGSGSRAAPTREASAAMGSLPQRPDPRHTARPVQDRSASSGAERPMRGCGDTLSPRGPPAYARGASGTRVRRLSPVRSRSATAARSHRSMSGAPSGLRWRPIQTGT